MTADRKLRIYCYALLAVAAIVAYGSTLNHGFVWDDLDIIVANPFLAKLSNIPRFFFWEDRIAAPTGYYRPITYVSFAFDRAFWGLNPLGFNITNLLLHILVSFLVFEVMKALFERDDLAVVVALLFCLHPIGAETVNFHAGGRNTLLCALFGLLALALHLRRKYAAAAVAFTLAIFSKEFALLIPAVMLLHDRTHAKEPVPWKKYVPYVIAALCYLGLRSVVVKAHGNLLKAANVTDTIWIVPRTVLTYLHNMLYPVRLKVLYDLDTVITWRAFIGGSLAILLMVALAVVFRKRREILFAVVMFLLFLLPVSNVFPLGAAMIADRYAYFALLGFCLAAGYVICLFKRPVAAVVTALLCVLFVFLDLSHNATWKDEASLYTQMTKDAPERAIGYQDLAVLYHSRQDEANAEKYLDVALTKAGLAGSMLQGFATMYLEMNRLDKAVAVLERNAKEHPDDPASHLMLGRIYEVAGRGDLARASREKAEALAPGFSGQLQERVVGGCRKAEELIPVNPKRAQNILEDVLDLDPFSVPALVDLGSLSARGGDAVKARQYFGRAAVLSPRDPAPHYNLSLVHASEGKKAEAASEMNRYQDLSVKR